MEYERNTVKDIFVKFSEEFRMLRYFIYGLLSIHDISPINCLGIGWLEVSQQLIKFSFRSK